MSAVLGLPPYLQFFDSNGDPLAGGKIYTYAAGTNTPKATYTDEGALTAADNPIDLDASGIPDTANGAMWLIGSYKFVVKDSLGNTIRTTDNVSAFTTLAAANDAFFQSFSGTGSQTAFTLSSDLGTEEKGLMVFVSKGIQSCVTNGTFATDTDWTKGAGWTIAAGVATAAGAISTALSQTAPVTLVEGQAYRLTYTITRSAGGLIPSIGGTAGTERVLSGTYNEVIVCGSSQTIAFTGNAFTGTLDTVSINIVAPAGFDILAPTAFTVSGTALTFTTAPATGTNNIYVFAPSLLLGAASAAANAAEASATAALASQVAAAASVVSAQAYAQTNKFEYSTTTTMADPATGKIRFNNATLASVTAIAISDLSDDAGNPDLSAWINTWGDDSGGSLLLKKDTDDFVRYNVTAATNNSGWTQLAVTYVNAGGTLANTDDLYIGYVKNGVTTVTGGITSLTGAVTGSGAGAVATTLATQAANTVLANATAGTDVPTAKTMAANSVLVRAGSNITDLALSTQQVVGRLGADIVAVGVGTSANNLVQLNGSSQLPAVDGSLLTGIGAPTGTPVAVSGTTAVITVDFTTYCAYKLYYFAASSGGAVTYTVEFSQNAGVGYLTTSYTLTGAATNLGAASTNDYVGGTLDIFQPATTGEIYAVVNFAAEDLSGNRNGVVDAPSTAAVNRVRISVTGSVTGFYTLVPQAKR